MPFFLECPPCPSGLPARLNVLVAFLEGPNPNIVFLNGVKKYYNLNSPTVQFELQIAWKTAGLFREVCIFLWLTRKTIVILKKKWWSHVAPARRLTVQECLILFAPACSLSACLTGSKLLNLKLDKSKRVEKVLSSAKTV